MIAAKLLVSRCFPLVIGGNWAILVLKSSDLGMVVDKSLERTLEVYIAIPKADLLNITMD
jgi:hypothetical protein